MSKILQKYSKNKIISLFTDEVIESEDSSNDEETIYSGPAHADAFSAIETATNWYEKIPECCLPQLIILRKFLI